jgi:predicted nucleotidyltransferase
MSNPERWARFRKLPPNIKQRLDQLIPLFEQEKVRLVYLFGSLSQGEAGHDVDLAILTEEKSAFYLWALITDGLETERVDLVDLRDASPSLRFEIIRTGQLLYEAEEGISQDFEMSTLRLYKDMSWLRRRQEKILRERIKKWSSNPNLSSKD